MASLVCPICGAKFEAERSAALPFCGPRCRDIDLGRWLGEKYTLPVISSADEAESNPTAPPSNAAEGEET